MAWFVYLGAQQFPPDLARLVPIAWLAGAVVAGVLAVRALRGSDGRPAAGLALAVSVPSAVFAAVFSLAALMGD
ncbi:hypothetical protein QFW77_02600 [Luteimonas sp. RD2P54]|uniref:Uncharacterized protein n=1 Tax=Luteimonas endophytica TaxID=3042023 RepID=A0ABT6J5L9_9GAMM|nr:hypothetical protein [Luteimonas endophytica]MDH5821885.1 hypothetical protein [Luteimonas endophytica]